MNTTNNILRSAALCLVAMLANVAAVAQNKLYIEDFSIVPGQSATVNVMLDNADNISALQFDVVLPAGLTSAYEYTMNSERMTSTGHSIQSGDVTIGAGTYDQYNGRRFSILAKGVDPAKTAIKGNSGAIFSIRVLAEANFKGGNITIREVIASDGTVIPATEIALENSETAVTAKVATFSLAPDSASLTLAKKDTVDFYLDNSITVKGMEARIVLPEGVEIEDVIPGERLSENVTPTYIASTQKLLIESMTNDEFANSNAPVFSLALKATAVVTGELVVSNVVVSDGDYGFDLEGTAAVAVEVIDVNKIVFEELSQDLDSIKQMLNDTLEVIRNYTTEEGKAWADSEEADALTNELTEEGLYLEAAFQAGTLDESYALYEKLNSYGERINTLAENAAKAEEDAKIIIGDANGDGEISIADANAIVNHFLGNEQKAFVLKAADVNADGEITVADANAVVNMFLNNQ